MCKVARGGRMGEPRRGRDGVRWVLQRSAVHQACCTLPCSDWLGSGQWLGFSPLATFYDQASRYSVLVQRHGRLHYFSSCLALCQAPSRHQPACTATAVPNFEFPTAFGSKRFDTTCSTHNAKTLTVLDSLDCGSTEFKSGFKMLEHHARLWAKIPRCWVSSNDS